MRRAAVAVIVLHLSGPAELPASAAAIDPHVRTAVAAGRARVIVTLRIAAGVRPEGELDAGAVAAQRQAIAGAQQAVLARLAATDAVVARRPTSVPLLALTIGADALRALEGMSDLVVSVVADDAVPPSGSPRSR